MSKIGSPAHRRELLGGALFERAAELFALKGFAATSLQDIADAAGISRQALYHYVDSKEGLLNMLVQAQVEGRAILEQLLEEHRDAEPVEQLHILVRAGAIDAAEHPHRFRMMDRSEAHLTPLAAERFRNARRIIVKGISAVIARGVNAGQFRVVDERVAALAIIGMWNYVAWWYRPDQSSPIEPLAELIAEIAVRSVLRCEPVEPGNKGKEAALNRLFVGVQTLRELLPD